MKLSIFNIHDVVVFITITMCLLLIAFHIFYPNKNKVAQYFLIAFLIDTAVILGCILVFWKPSITISPLIDNRIIPCLLLGSLLLKGPLLYGYIYSITTPNYRLGSADVIHLIPIAAYFFTFPLTNGNTDSANMYLQNGEKIALSLSLYEWSFVKITPVIYAAIAVYKVNQYNKKCGYITPHFSHGNAWLTILAWGALFNWAWSLGAHVVGTYANASIADTFGILDNYITLCLIFMLLFYGLAHTNKQLTINLNERELFYEARTESLMLQKLIHCMEVEKLFLNPRLNIERLAEHIKIPYRDVSTMIHQHFHTNFNEYINIYRINEAKRLLSDSQLINLPVNEIYARAGFNSKSAFHRFFNKLVGISPTEFRKTSTKVAKTHYSAAV